MGGGILSGAMLGLVVSGVVLSAVSLSSPLPPRPGVVLLPPAVTVPEAGASGATGGETAQEASADAPVEGSAGGQDEPAAAPAPAATEVAPETAPEPAPAPPAAPVPVAPSADAPPAPQDEAALGPAPQSAVSGAATAGLALSAPPAPEAQGRLPSIATAPRQATPVPQASAPPRDDAPVAASPAEMPDVAAAPGTPVPPSPAIAPRPQFSTTADGGAGGDAPRRLTPPQDRDRLALVDTGPAPAPLPVTAPAPQADVDDTPPRRLPQVAVPAPMASADSEQGVGPSSPALAPAAAGSASRLPQAGVPAPAEPAASPPPDPEMPVAAAPMALRDNAAAFDVPADSPLLAVVLIDEPGGGIDPAALIDIGFPVSFAIDPMRPDAATRASELRAAGHEVVILGAPAIPQGAAPGDVEVALSVARETMPQAVALMDDPQSRIQGDRPVLDATVGTLVSTGHGLIAYPRGLNAAEETARRAGVPAATVFRLLDDEDQSAPVISRFLGRAAFAAAQEGAAVVVGRTRPDTVTALFSWALANRTEGVALAPVSAVLLRLSE